MKRKKNAKKSILIIGMGRFGEHLAVKLIELGNSVMVVDESETVIQKIPITFENVMIGDCTNENVIKSLGVGNFDICFVATGASFESSLIITSLLKTFGAKYIVSKAGKTMQIDMLKKIGADEVVYPERDLAEKVAVKYSTNNIYDYINLGGDFAIYEIAVLADWIGKSIAECNIRSKYKINIIAIKNDAIWHSMIEPDYIFASDDILVVISKSQDIQGLG